MILQFYFKESYSVLKIHVVVKLGCGNSSNMHESPVVARVAVRTGTVWFARVKPWTAVQGTHRRYSSVNKTVIQVQLF